MSAASTTRIGVGLPSAIAGTPWPVVLDWGRRIEALGFDAVAAIDRVVFDSYEPLMALAAVAAITERVELVTNILIGPVRNSAVLAKQTATLARIAGGRVVLGIGLGARPDDYEAAGVPWTRRGRLLDAQLDELQAIWDGAPRGMAGGIGPTIAPGTRPQVVIGGSPAIAAPRVARVADGWTMAHGGAVEFAAAMAEMQAAWEREGRAGRPRGMALFYYALGDDAGALAKRAMREYYGHAPPERQANLIAAVATDAETIRTRIDALAQAGADDVFLLPCSGSGEQLDLLAEAVALHPQPTT